MLAWLAYMTVSVVWGSTFLAIAYAIESFTPFGLSAARFVPAGLLALAIGRLRGERLPARRELPHLAAVGVLLLTVCMALIGWAEGRVSSGVTAVLAATVPLFLGLLEPRGLDLKGWGGLSLGFLGVAALLWPSGRGPDLAGSLSLVVSAFIWSYGTVHGKRHRSAAGHFTQVGVEMLTAGLLAGILAPLTGGFVRGPVGASSALALAYLTVFGSILAYTAYIYLSRVWTAARAGTYAFWNPVVGVALGYAVRGERCHASMLWGLGLILLGVGLVQVPTRWLDAPARARRRRVG